MVGASGLQQKRGVAVDDSMCCWRLLLRLCRRRARQRAVNSVTMEMDWRGGACGTMPGPRAVSWVCQCWRGLGRGSWAWSVGRRRSAGLDKEGAAGQLEGSDGTEGVGEGCLEMSEDMGGGLVCGGQFGGRAAAEESGADLALGVVEAVPDAQ